MYIAKEDRYEKMVYTRCGKSGLKLPKIALGLWQNFGDGMPYENIAAMLTTAFDLGINHFDLANNYGPAPGAAEENFGRVMKKELKPYRDELIISTKAGYEMWPGPYGNGGSRKYLLASLDQSLKRMGLEYVDIFYSHRYDAETPIEETMMALDRAVRSGKALYAGISSYDKEKTAEAIAIAKDLGTPILIHQPCYHMFNRWTEDGLFDVLEANGVGSIAFCPLDRGMLAGKYLEKDPENANEEMLIKAKKVRKLNEIAKRRGQTMAQFSLAWLLNNPQLTTALIGASRPSQIVENVGALKNTSFTKEELAEIDAILNG